jgi:hypothetical protein
VGHHCCLSLFLFHHFPWSLLLLLLMMWLQYLLVSGLLVVLVGGVGLDLVGLLIPNVLVCFLAQVLGLTCRVGFLVQGLQGLLMLVRLFHMGSP